MSGAAPTRRIVGPFNRVEGDLEVHLDLDQGRVASARVNAPLFRGFETMLDGKPPSDALVLAPRICGICSVAQSQATAKALAAAMGLAIPDNGRRAFHLLLGAENAADHLVHFHLFFMPDFTHAAYAGRPWHGRAVQRFQPGAGQALVAAARLRARFFQVMGILAGKWPHSLALQPGGSSKPVDRGERSRLRALVAEFRAHVEEHLFAAPLGAFADLADRSDLTRFAARHADGDAALFLAIAADLGLAELGRAPGPALSYGAYAEAEGALFPAGLWDGKAVRPLDLAGLLEDPAHAWMAGAALHPGQGETRPDLAKAQAYSWCKAPRLNGQAVEVGALARQLIAGHPLIRALWADRGSNVESRVVARLLEIARLVPALERWAAELEPDHPFCHPAVPIERAQGVGLVEAARGGLGHWLTVEDGRIARYQIIAPTTWNFSPRDGAGLPGPLEQALVGAPVGNDEATPIAVQHVVRSFDPCMVCTVH
ncbi:MAG: nickel-dependent hydrogenase large subunit [Rhodospirillales bacterium]|nr:nickel-dependent hydrogenase large subunit [Rhodospirillales bacterium]